MTLEKLAELSGVSVGTVSKAFKGSPEISKKTRDKIFNIAKKYGCFNKYYRSPRTRPVIALLAPEPESEYYGREIGVLERALFLRGADTVIAFTRFSPEKEARLFGILAYEMKVQGFILWSSGNLIKNPDQIPLVTLVSGEKSPENSDVIRIDTNSAILELAKTIKNYGHTRVGFIGEKLTSSKEKKLKMALRSVGIPVHDKYFVNSDKRFMEAGMEVKLVKEPDNEVDKEAVKVELEGLGLIGYVANSPYTVLGESMSAGRLYDKISAGAIGVVKYKLPGGVLCEIKITETCAEE